MALRRLMAEYKQISNNPPDGIAAGFDYYYFQENLAWVLTSSDVSGIGLFGPFILLLKILWISIFKI